MGSFSPEMLPVLSTLAKNFAVYDAWHCARAVADVLQPLVLPRLDLARLRHEQAAAAATASGSTRRPRRRSSTGSRRPASRWRIYFDELQLVSFTGVLHAPVLEKYWRTDHFATMEQFYADVENGKLPAYAFIEPRMIYNHNDFHPPFGTLRESDVDGTEVVDSAISDVRAGEALIHEIYSAIKQSASTDGSNALNTMLLITFDEHGGTLRPRATARRDAARRRRDGRRDGLQLRPPRMPRSGHRHLGLHACGHASINDEMHHGPSSRRSRSCTG